MTEINKQPTTEAGRSMVEMLGVLAIVGVLSIGGIAGYNLGMEKQRANELLEASLQRAYTVSAQLLTGRNASLVEFNQDTRKAGGEFETTVETAYSGGIGIKITGVNQNICKALVRSMTDNSPLRGVSLTGTQNNITEEDCQKTNNLTLLYNDDMGQENIDFACLNNPCKDNEKCVDGECFCANGEEKCQKECCPVGYTCSRSPDGLAFGCINIQSDSECLSNNDCYENEYCDITATYDNTLPACFKNIKGTCKSNTNIEYPDLIATEQIEGISETAWTKINNSFSSSSPLSWWSAKNFCESHGSTLFDYNDFECASLSFNSYGYCCLNPDNDCASDITMQSDVARAYREAYNKSSWLMTNSNQCGYYFISSSNSIGGVNSAQLRYALCR